jgi:glycosyltransferase involved in cell wall biosynthesis
LRGHIQAAAAKYEVTVVCNAADVRLLDGLNARVILLPVERKPSPWKDLLTLLQLLKLFRREHFDIVHTHMPKTGLLGMLAARLAFVPVRIHTFHGEVWATRRGWQRMALKSLDRLVSLLATNVLAVSPSQLAFLIKEGALPAGKASVIGAGSVCGVDPFRFCPDTDARRIIRDTTGIPHDAKVILFVGRLNRDKGMLDLATAFNALAKDYRNAVLLLVGAEEDVSFGRMQEMCVEAVGRVHYQRFTSTPERYMAAADIFCLPSYREGLPMTVIEAAACEVPCVASRIYGITDAVEEDRTGLLFTAGNVTELAQALGKLISDDEFRRQMGHAARKRALELFPAEKITREMVSFYDFESAKS